MALTIAALPAENQILGLLSVAEMKENLRIGYTKEDELIKRCILAAYDWLSGENGWLRRAIIATDFTLTLPAFSSQIELPRPPLRSVTTVKYRVDGTLTLLDSAVYRVRKQTDGFSYIGLGIDQEWPTTVDRDDGEAIEIVFSAGMADTGANAKAKYPSLHKAMALLAGDYFRNREDTFTDIRMVEINRKIVNGVSRVAGRYRFRNDYGS